MRPASRILFLVASVAALGARAEVTTMNCSNCTAMTPPAAIVGSSITTVTTRQVDTGNMSFGSMGGIGGTSASFFLYSMKGPSSVETKPVQPASNQPRDKFSAVILTDEESRQLTQFAVWIQESIPPQRLNEPIFDALKVLSYVILNGPAARKDIYANFPNAKDRDSAAIITLKDAYENAVRAQNEMVVAYVAGNPKGGTNANLDYLHTNLSSLRAGLVQSNLQ